MPSWPLYLLLGLIVLMIWANVYLLIQRLRMARDEAERRLADMRAKLHTLQWKYRDR